MREIDVENKSYAPIVLFVYARPDHAEQTINALAKNYLASKSPLIIFCDGPKKESVKEKNQEVIDLIKREKENSRFASVTLNISKENKGLAKSIISGVSEVMAQYGRCIVIEDDVVTSKYFLTYMNEGLNYYGKDEEIFSIAGFTYPLKALEKYPHDVYYSYRSCSMCWASWKDRWEGIDWEVKDYKELEKSYKKRKQFNRGGNDLFRMLRHQIRGERDSWAVRYCYAQSKLNMYAVYPKYSLAQNIGNDGSGTHCANLGKKANEVNLKLFENIKFEKVGINKAVVKDFKLQYRVTFLEAVDWLKRRILRRNERRKH